MNIILLILFCGIIALWIRGGQKGGGAIRDVGVPILLGLGLGLAIHDNILNRLLYGIFTCALFQMIRLGYGNFDPEHDDKPSFLASITHDRGGWWIRAIYGLLVALVGCLAARIGHYISLPIYLAYIVGNALIGFSVSRFALPVFATDFLIGAGFGSLLFII